MHTCTYFDYWESANVDENLVTQITLHKIGANEKHVNYSISVSHREAVYIYIYTLSDERLALT